MNQQSTQRPESLPFRVSINATRGLNIILSDRGIKNERPCSLFVTLEQAEQFTADLEAALSNGHYTCLDHCVLCGKPFTRTDDVCMLTDNREAHRKRKSQHGQKRRDRNKPCCEKTIYADKKTGGKENDKSNRSLPTICAGWRIAAA